VEGRWKGPWRGAGRGGGTRGVRKRSTKKDMPGGLVREPPFCCLRPACLPSNPRRPTSPPGDPPSGNHYVMYAERAAREACASLSPFTSSSLDAAIQKALRLALSEAGLVGQRRAGHLERAAGQVAKKAEALGAGAPPWGPYEDEVLADLMTTSLYPLFMSPQVTNGGAPESERGWGLKKGRIVTGKP
jgi:hypothetical protein